MIPAARDQTLLMTGFSALMCLGVLVLDDPSTRHDAAYPRDSKGERPIVALWTEAFPDRSGDLGKGLILAIWENGDVLWRNELRPTNAPLVSTTITPEAARSVLKQVSEWLRSHVDEESQALFLHEPTLVLGFIDAGGQCRVSTSHTMAPDLPNILKLRFNRIVVNDDTRERVRARFTPHSLAFIPTWDRTMSALSEALRATTPTPALTRRILWLEGR
jgi:hypothetical protein